MASKIMQLGIGLKVGPLVGQGEFKKWSKEVGAASGAMGISIFNYGIGPNWTREISSHAEHGREEQDRGGQGPQGQRYFTIPD